MNDTHYSIPGAASGIYKEMGISEYCLHPAISRSDIVRFRKSPKHFIVSREADEPTRPMTLGNAIHCALLEPDKYIQRYFIAPECDRRTKAGKEMWQAAIDSAQMRTLLTTAEDAQIQGVISAVNESEIPSAFIKDAEYEVSYIWDADIGLQCKARPDILRSNCIVDIKTTRDASEYSFEQDVYKYGYYIQAAMIQDAIWNMEGKLMKDFIFIAIEKEYPFAIGVYALAEYAIEEGRREYLATLAKIKECHIKGHYPSYEAKEIGLPSYIKRRMI